MTDTATPAAPGGLRITFYGVQGSGSTSPSRGERVKFQEKADAELLLRVFDDIRRRAGPDGRLNKTVDDLLGGPYDGPDSPVARRLVEAYRRRIAVPELRVYGGWTTCVRVETPDGYDLVFDLGSGFRQCAKDLVKKWVSEPKRDLYVFGSHSHLDHTEGFDQAPVCFDPRNTIHVYGNRQFLRALDANLGIFTRKVAEDVKGVQTPVFFALMPAKFEACEIRDFAAAPPPAADDLARAFHDVAQPVRLGNTTVQPFEVFHPAPCLAYRVDHGGKSFVFCTDHELRHGPDEGHPHERASRAAEERLKRHAAGADLLYRDGQYLRAEYDGHKGIGTSGAVPRVDWGHSCMEDIVDMVRECGVKRALIGHHDPNREWDERIWMDEMLGRTSKGTDNQLELARAETVVEL